MIRPWDESEEQATIRRDTIFPRWNYIYTYNRRLIAHSDTLNITLMSLGTESDDNWYFIPDNWQIA